MNSLGPDCCWCCVALGERDGELDPDHTHLGGECDWCDGPGRAFNPMPIMEAFTDTHGRAGVRVLVDLPGLGIAAGSEFLTLEAGQ